MRLFLSAALVGLTIAPLSAGAAPITVSDPNGYLILDNRANNSLGRSAGLRINYGVTSVLPNGSNGTTSAGTTVNTATNATVSAPIVFSGSPAIPNLFGASIPYSANLLGPRTLTFTNGSDTKTITTPSLAGVQAAPFATNVTFSGSSLNPTFTWSYPAGSVNGVFFDIFDQSIKNASGGAALVFSKTLAGTSNSFTVPSVLAQGIALVTGHQYTLDLYGVVNRPGTTVVNNPNSQAWSESYFDFTPLAIGSPVVNLPSLTANNAYQYNTGVTQGQTYYFDPSIAIGYDYATGIGDPNFATVTLPAIQPGPFNVSFSAGGVLTTASVQPSTAYAFPTGGVSAFRVSGIDPALQLDPANTLAFVTGLSFAGSGTFTGTQTPILVDVGTAVPEPGTLVLIGAGILASLVMQGDRRRGRS